MNSTNFDIIHSKPDLQVLIDFGSVVAPGYLCDSKDLALAQPKFRNALAISTGSGLVQQLDKSARQIMLDKVYSNYQSTYNSSNSLSSYMNHFLDYALKISGLQSTGAVLEIGSNNGSVVKALASRGYQVVGIDPSSPSESASNYVLHNGFYSASTVQSLQMQGRFQLIFSRHTLEHVYQPADFLLALSQSLSEDGRALIEVPYLPLQVLGNHFEGMSVQHESHFTLSSLNSLVKDVDMRIVDIRFSGLDGGSTIVCLAKGQSTSDKLSYYINSEIQQGFSDGSALEAYAERLHAQISLFRSYLLQRSRSSLLAGYGAGSKGCQISNLLDLGEGLAYVIDDIQSADSPRFIPGCATKVISSEDASSSPPDIILITAPTHIREVAHKARHLFPSAEILATSPYFSHVDLWQS